MAQRNIDFGSFPDDPNADAIRTAFDKVQQNFTELFSGLQEQAVISVNRTAGTGITVNSPTGNVIVSANIAQVRIQSSTLDLSTGSNASPASLAVINSGTTPFFINLPQNVTGISNITLAEKLTAANATISSHLTGNTASFTGNISTSNTLSANAVAANTLSISSSAEVVGSLTVTGNANVTTNLTAANLSSTGNISAIGNLSAGNINGGNVVVANYFSGDGSNLTNVIAAPGTKILNGTSYANISNVNGNLDVVVTGNPVLTVTGTGANITGTLGVTGNITAGNFVGTLSGAATSATTAGTVTTNAQPNITSVGTLTSLGVSGNVTAANITANTGVFTGNGSGLSALNASNLSSGTVPSARLSGSYSISVTSATTAGTVTTNAQPNITSVGTLTGLGVNGNITAANITANTGVFTGNASGLSAINASNITTGTLAQARLANSSLTVGNTNISLGSTVTSIGGLTSVTATTFNGTLNGNASSAATVTSAAQPNITSVGTLSSLSVSGNATAGNVYANSGTIGASLLTGTLTTAAQPNVTSVGTLSTLAVSGNITAGNINAGNLLSANYIQGDGSLLTNIAVSAGTSIVNGTSNVVVDPSGNVNFSVNSNQNIVVVADTGAIVNGTLTANLLAGNIITAAQPNITSVGNLTSLKVNGISNLGPNGNVIITGGVSGAFLKTDGAGSLSWDTATLVPAQGANTQVIFNDGGSIYAGNAGLTFNKNTGALTVAGNLSAGNINGANNIAANFFTGTLRTNAQPNITSVGTLTSLGVNGTVTAVAFTANTGVFTGNGSGLTDLNANSLTTGIISSSRLSGTYNISITGSVASANTANTAGTVTTNAQPNITAVGTLVGLQVNGTVSAANITVPSGTITANLFSGNAANLTNIPGANVSGTVANATYATSAGSATTATNATTADTVTANAQPNITSVGTLTSLAVSGNVTASRLISNVATGNSPFVVTSTTRVANLNVATAGNADSATNAAAVQSNTSTASTVYILGTATAGNANVSLEKVSGIYANMSNNSITATTFVGSLSGTATSATSATTAGTVTTNAQPNITSVSTSFTGLTLVANGNIALSGANSQITGANSVSANFISGNGSALIALNASNISSGTLAQARLANSSLTVNGTSISLGGSGTITANTTQTLSNGSYITGDAFNGGTARTWAVDATTTSTANKIVARDANANIYANNAIFTTVSGNGAGLSAIAGANVTGTVSSATIAGTVTTNAQPNITSVGTLTSLGVNGTVTAVAFTANTGVFTGNGSGLSAIAGANVTGTVANATYAVNAGSATTAGTVTTNAQPNITSTGTLTGLTVSGNIVAQANVNMSGYVIRSVTTGISAAGTAQANATAITTEMNVVSTIASGAGVRLPTAVAGMAITITNISANTLLVYPHSGGDINGAAINAAYSQPAGATLQFIAPNTTDWYTVGATFA